LWRQARASRPDCPSGTQHTHCRVDVAVGCQYSVRTWRVLAGLACQPSALSLTPCLGGRCSAVMFIPRLACAVPRLRLSLSGQASTYSNPSARSPRRNLPQGWPRQLSVLAVQIRMEFCHPTVGCYSWALQAVRHSGAPARREGSLLGEVGRKTGAVSELPTRLWGADIPSAFSQVKQRHTGPRSVAHPRGHGASRLAHTPQRVNAPDAHGVLPPHSRRWYERGNVFVIAFTGAPHGKGHEIRPSRHRAGTNPVMANGGDHLSAGRLREHGLASGSGSVRHAAALAPIWGRERRCRRAPASARPSSATLPPATASSM